MIPVQIKWLSGKFPEASNGFYAFSQSFQRFPRQIRAIFGIAQLALNWDIWSLWKARALMRVRKTFGMMLKLNWSNGFFWVMDERIVIKSIKTFKSFGEFIPKRLKTFQPHNHSQTVPRVIIRPSTSNVFIRNLQNPVSKLNKASRQPPHPLGFHSFEEN